MPRSPASLQGCFAGKEHILCPAANSAQPQPRGTGQGARRPVPFSKGNWGPWSSRPRPITSLSTCLLRAVPSTSDQTGKCPRSPESCPVPTFQGCHHLPPRGGASGAQVVGRHLVVVRHLPADPPVHASPAGQRLPLPCQAPGAASVGEADALGADLLLQTRGGNRVFHFSDVLFGVHATGANNKTGCVEHSAISRSSKMNCYRGCQLSQTQDD